MNWLIVAVLASIFRLLINNLREFSQADETTYLRQIIDTRPLREALKAHAFNVPPPYRLGCTWIGRLFRVKTHRGLANLSTFFSVATVFAVCFLARPESRVVAALLIAATPIGLAMGRRALQDSAVSCMVVVFFLCADREWLWLAVCAGIVLASFKEVAFVFAAPAVATLWLLHGGRWSGALAMVLIPPVSYGALLLLIVRDFRLLLQKSMATLSQGGCPYATAYGQGPAHTYLAQWFVLSPVVSVAALMAHGGALRTGALGYVVLLSLTKFKNFRMFVGADALLRVVAAMCLSAVRYGWLIAALNVAIELRIFSRVFVAGRVYDPVFANVAEELRMIPRTG